MESPTVPECCRCRCSNLQHVAAAPTCAHPQCSLSLFGALWLFVYVSGSRSAVFCLPSTEMRGNVASVKAGATNVAGIFSFFENFQHSTVYHSGRRFVRYLKCRSRGCVYLCLLRTCIRVFEYSSIRASEYLCGL